MKNILARHFGIGSKISEEIGSAWGHPPTNTCVVALRYVTDRWHHRLYTPVAHFPNMDTGHANAIRVLAQTGRYKFNLICVINCAIHL